ncbi:hypothetical protein PPM_0742 [Paenibacillus polymyxa M1]|nr:hypothetical protein PPM_0742 [Paenibacillus polymyxa M1]
MHRINGALFFTHFFIQNVLKAELLLRAIFFLLHTHRVGTLVLVVKGHQGVDS